MSSFVKRFPQFMPELIDRYEPPTGRFDLAEFAASFWKKGYDQVWIAERKKPGIRFHCMSNALSSAEHYRCDANEIGRQALIELLIWSVQRPCLVAYCHVLSPQEAEHGLSARNTYHWGRSDIPLRERRDYSYGDWWSYRSLAYGLPDLPWITVFGPRYVRFFSKERLLSAPAYRAEEVAQDTVLIQLCEDYHEIDMHWDRFNTTREAVIDHLGPSAFSRLRQPGDPPPTWEREALMDVGEENVPPEFLPIRRRDEKIFAERPVLPEPLSGLADMIANAKRLKVATVGDSRVLIDTARKEMVGFADRAQADEWIDKLIAAGAVVKGT